jgi:hypothetical protein
MTPWTYVPRVYGFRVVGRTGSRAASVLPEIEAEEAREMSRARAITEALESALEHHASASASAEAEPLPMNGGRVHKAERRASVDESELMDAPEAKRPKPALE